MVLDISLNSQCLGRLQSGLLGLGLGLEAKFSGLGIGLETSGLGLGLEDFGLGFGLVFLALALASFKAKAKVKVTNILPNTVYHGIITLTPASLVPP